jgi:hypothetical protein
MAVTFFPTNPNVARSIGAYNANLSAENIARIQEATAVEQARIQAQAQRDALRANAEQNYFANQLRQQELQQQGAYQQGQLANQRASTQAQLDWQKAVAQANTIEGDKDRANRVEIAKLGANRNAPSAVDIQEINNRAQAMAGRLNFAIKDLKAAQAAEEKAVNDAFTQDMARITPFTSDAAFKAKRDKALMEVQNRYRGQIQQLLRSVPEDAALDFDQNRLEFVPKIIAPTAGTPNPFTRPAVNPDAILKEAADAIAAGANPAAVQERLQNQFGLSLPQVPTVKPLQPPIQIPATVWPPPAETLPALPPPAAAGGVMPVPGNAPAFGSYFRQ